MFLLAIITPAVRGQGQRASPTASEDAGPCEAAIHSIAVAIVHQRPLFQK